MSERIITHTPEDLRFWCNYKTTVGNSCAAGLGETLHKYRWVFVILFYVITSRQLHICSLFTLSERINHVFFKDKRYATGKDGSAKQ